MLSCRIVRNFSMNVCGISHILSFAIIGYVYAQQYYEELHMARAPQLSQMPNRFEIKSNNANTAKTEFEKYAHQIQHIAKAENGTVIYKINMQMLKPHKGNFIKKLLKKAKTKKYNVPLKKNSMKLSNFESFLRKMAEQNNHNSQKYEFNMPTPTESQQVMTTKLMKTKYKPIPSKLSNYSKIIKPVRNRLITLKV